MWTDFLHRIRAIFHRETVEHELDDELQFHLERQTEKYIKAGIDPSEARRRAQLEFGGSDTIKEDCRDARGTRWLEDLVQDFRYATRLLGRSPVFAAVAVLSLALGIGANTAIFSLLDRVMLQTLPVPEPERLVEIGSCCLSYPLVQELQQKFKSVEGLMARNVTGVLDITIDGHAETADFDMASGSYYTVLRVHPAIGRVFTEDVDRVPGASPVAVISHRYWERRFASDPAVIGKTFRRLNTEFTIIGVTPPAFFGPEVGRNPDITVPLMMDAAVKGDTLGLTDTGYWWLAVMGRLKPGVGLDQARAEWKSLHPSTEIPLKNKLYTWNVQLAGNGFDRPRQRFQEPLAILMITALLVLLLACANLANLLLAKAAARQREIAVRLAIGAGRGRVVRQLLAEGLLLALMGGTLGVLLAYGFAEGLVTVISNGGLRLLVDVSPDTPILFFALAVSLVACVLFSLAPAIMATRQNVQPALAEVRAARWHLGKSLIVAQMAISVLLLVGAGLFFRTVINIYSLDAGFDRHGVVLFSTNATGSGRDTDQLQRVRSRVLSELKALPEVQSATMSKYPPVSRGSWQQSLVVEGHADDDVPPHLNSIAPDYFKTFGTPLVLGREFDDRDTASSEGVAIINEAFSRYYFQDQSPLGRWVAFNMERTHHYEIVGVVKDAKYESLRDDFPRIVYLSAAQVPPGDSHTFAVRTTAGMAAVASSIKSVLADVDPSLRAIDIRTMEDHVARSLLEERLLAMLVGFFAGLALLLGVVGIYGVMTYQVERRRREIGIRVALGADARSVTGMILGQTARLTLLGCVIGSLAGSLLTRVTAGILYGVRPNDPFTFAAAITGLLLVALGAAYLPGRKAARNNPVETLRTE